VRVSLCRGSTLPEPVSATYLSGQCSCSTSM
jgi:hypothetical protein